jgi:alpha-D-xyloside xylohydrolase
LHIGSGLEYTNIFPFEHTSAFQEHWKQANPEKRVFLLTRSAFLGQQRNGATVWSGDVYGSWWALRRQIAAGLNFALSGYPYWTTDIGGYHWSPYGTSTIRPIRSSTRAGLSTAPSARSSAPTATATHNELWVYDRVYPGAAGRRPPALPAAALRLLAGMEGDQRGLHHPAPAGDGLPRGPATWEIGDEFLFGPAILVSPVLKEHATQRRSICPPGRDWYDFWTGSADAGGRRGESGRAARPDSAQSVRAGSILPLGPAIEYAGQASDPIELRIYPGANGDFNLYEDEGDSYRYEQGAHSIIPMHWDDAADADHRRAPGKLSRHGRRAHLQRGDCSAGHGVATAAETIQYTGVTEARF